MMRLPEYFKSAPVLTMYDPARRMPPVPPGMGSSTTGSGGCGAPRCHSLPHRGDVLRAHVLGAGAPYWRGAAGRSTVRAVFGDGVEAGVTGAIASIVGLLCGAAVAGGFGGIAGRFSRRGLMQFGVGGEAVFCLQRPTRVPRSAFRRALERVPRRPGCVP